MIADMTATLGTSIIWCMAQVTLIAVAGLGVSWLIARRSPTLGSSVITAAMIVAGLLTILAPFPLHRCFTPGSTPLEPSSGIRTNDARIDTPGRPTDHNVDKATSNSLWIDVETVREVIRTVSTRVKTIENERGTELRWGGLLLAMIAAIGIIRFAIGTMFVLSIRYRSRPVIDAQLAIVVRDVSSRLNCRIPFDIREHIEFTDAAVAGWFRPILVLPRGWRDWEVHELRSVIAHELAHIVRRDSIGRLMAAVVSAMHFYNPLIYGLLRRLTLYQELAADALAADVIGKKTYLRSLSSLAIRHDDLSRRSVSPDILPVFSGQLIRRIKVLISRDGTNEASLQTNHRWKSVAIMSAFLLIGISALAVRGNAEPPATEKKGTIETKGTVEPVTKVSFVKSRDASDEKPDIDPTREMFRHQPLEPEMGPNHAHGMMVFRVKELFERSQMASYRTILNGQLSQALTESLESKTAIPVELRGIEWIAGVPCFSVIQVKNLPSDRDRRLMMGTGEIRIRFNQSVDLDGWIESYAPKAVRHDIDGHSVFQMTVPFLGPLPFYVWKVDNNTLATTAFTREYPKDQQPASLDDVAAQIHRKKNPANPVASPWESAWKRMDSGLVSIVLAFADLSGLDENEYKKLESEGLVAPDAIAFVRCLQSRCVTTAISFDLDQENSEIGIRFNFTHASHESANASIKQLETLTKTVQRELPIQLEKLDPNDLKNASELTWNRLFQQAFRTGFGSVETHTDGTASLYVSATVPFQHLVQALNSE